MTSEIYIESGFEVRAYLSHISDGQAGKILYLHGIGGDASNFDDLISGFDGYHHYAVNLPGYGNAPYQKGDFTFAGLSARLAKLLSTLSADAPVHLVGHSIGGMIALDHAIRHPEQVKSLTMIAATSAFGGKDERFKEAFLKARLAPLDAGMSMAEMARKAAPHLVAPDAEAEIIAKVEASLGAISQDIWRDILVCLTAFNRREDITTFALPTLVIAGKYDDNAPAKSLEKMAGKLMYGQFHLVEKAGHILPLEAPDDIRQALLDFWSVFE